MGKEREGPEKELKKWMVAADFSRIEGMKLYGAGITDSKHLDLLVSMLKDFPYVGKLRSAQKRAVVQSFPVKFRKYENYVNLFVSPSVKKVIDFVEKNVGNSPATLVVDPKVYRGIKARFSGKSVEIFVEDKKELRHIFDEFMHRAVSSLLNVVDVSIRWSANLFRDRNVKNYVHISKGNREQR